MTPPEFVPFHRPDLGEPEIAAVVECLRSGWLTTGPRCREFEDRFAAYLGARHAVAVNSCTAGLHLALEALGIGPGDAVLVPTLTFTATAEVVQYLGARPVLVDVDPVTLNIDVADAERRLLASPDPVRAIIPVHFGGLPCDMDAVWQLAERRALDVVEDAAHALPTSYRGQPVGTLGSAAAFSFYATKNITTGEGGMVTTNDPALAERARCMSLHGISRDAWNRYTAEGSWYYEVVAAGYKYNMTDIAAALGLVQLSRCDEMRHRRAAIASEYSRAFAGTEALHTPYAGGPDVQHAWHLYPLRLRLDCLRIQRAQVIDELRDLGVGASVHFIPLHLQPHYRDRFGYVPRDLPVAAGLYPELVSLPLFSAMTPAEVERVIAAVLTVCRRHEVAGRATARDEVSGHWAGV
ncbi:MAG: DegT/DnrJ/EryC1/StrS family aminotransferase [Actinomycetota bacterium]